jgi:DMSO/TMAO reductase YedYZ molybdopterin-dependent catalytic subunit
MRPIVNLNQRIKRLWLIISKKEWFCSLLVAVLGLLLAGSFGLTALVAAAAEISVTVTGDGVTTPTTFTRAQLETMPQVQATYSTINTWPTKKWYVAKGVKLADLLTAAGIKDDAKTIKVTATDSFTKSLTLKQLQDPRYYYPGLKENDPFLGYIPGNSEGAQEVDTIIALKSVEGSDNPAEMSDIVAPLLVLGQRWITEQTNELFVKTVNKIEVFTTTPAKWENPAAAPAGGTVSAGTKVALSTSDMDGDNIHYTTDGSDPSYKTLMYNWIKKRWWSSREEELATINHPIEITNDTVIKAVAIGPGKYDSDIVTFNYHVILAAPPVLTADNTNNTVGRDVYLTFTDDADWRAAITGVTLNGNSIAGQYSVTTGTITLDAGVFTAAGDYAVAVKATGYIDAAVTQTINAAALLTAPDLTPDTTGNEIGQAADITFTDDADWRAAITGITVNGSALTAGQYTVTAGNINIIADVFTAAGDYAVAVKAGGYSVASVMQNMLATGGVPGTGDVVLTITGNGVANEVKLTLAQLKAMTQVKQKYSAINTWPTKKWYVGEGVSLKDLLDLAGMKGGAGLVKFTAADGFTIKLTVKELLYDKRYLFPHFKDNSSSDGDGNIPGPSAGAQEVETVLGLVSAEGTDDFAYMNDLNSPLLMLGQRAVTEQSGQLFVKIVKKIEVLTDSPQKWDNPQANPAGGDVPAGTLVKLSNAHMDDDKIHYTTDGSAPDMNSLMYNWIARRWWSSRADVLDIINHPIEINKNTTIKAVTIGPGKMDSDVVTFSYLVKETATDTAKIVTPGTSCTINLGSEAAIEVPANALKETGAVEVKIQKVTAFPAVPAGLKLVSGVYEFIVGDKKSYSFAGNVTIKLSFDPSAVSAGESPAIYYYDEAAGLWVIIGGTVSGNTITVEVDHFTKFAVMAAIKAEEKIPKDQILTDIAGHWAENSIKELIALGAIGGYPDGSFKPDNTITRAEFVTVLVKAFKLEPRRGKIFADIAGHWAQDAVSSAVYYGIVNGYDINTFGPDDPVTREQMAAMTVKAAGLTPATEKISFMDSESISGWARNSMATAVKNGIIKGYPGNTVRPRNNSTRAEAATVIVNACNCSGG